jgi:hypothetical protein
MTKSYCYTIVIDNMATAFFCQGGAILSKMDVPTTQNNNDNRGGSKSMLENQQHGATSMMDLRIGVQGAGLGLVVGSKDEMAGNEQGP